MNSQGNATDSIRPVGELAPTAPSHKLVRLSPEEYAIVLHGIAGISPSPTDTPSPADSLLRPTGPVLSTSLYASIIHLRKHALFRYKILSIFYNVAVIVQIFFGAVITALSSSNTRHQVAITILAAANTVNAGLLALMYNSGLPERAENDFGEFDKVEQHVRSLIDTGIVREGWTTEEIIADCWDKFARAKEVIGKNRPANYKGSGVDKSTRPEAPV